MQGQIHTPRISPRASMRSVRATVCVSTPDGTLIMSIHIHLHMYMHVYKYTLLCVYKYTLSLLNIYMYVYTCTWLHCMYIYVYIYNNVCTHTHVRIHPHRKIAKSLYKLRQSHTMRVNTWRHFKPRHPCRSRGCRTIKIARFQPMRTMKRCRIHLWSRDHDRFLGGNRNLRRSFSIQSLFSSFCHQKQNIGWFQLVGSIKLLVSFAKEPYKRDYILQKRPTILSILLIVATPYVHYGNPEKLYLTTTYEKHISTYIYTLIHYCNMYMTYFPRSYTHKSFKYMHVHIHMTRYMSHIYLYIYMQQYAYRLVRTHAVCIQIHT